MKQSVAQRLAPCPFCGKEDISVHAVEGDRGRFAVTCLICDCRMTGESKIEAEDKWNGRTPERLNKVLVAKIARLEDMLAAGPRGYSEEAKRIMRLNSTRRPK